MAARKKQKQRKLVLQRLRQEQNRLQERKVKAKRQVPLLLLPRK